MAPEALDNLTPEERRHVYKMLKIKIIVYPNDDVEVSGALRECFTPENQHEGVGPKVQNIMTPELLFRALLDGAEPDVWFERA
jgi:hypothetical protein